MLFRSLKYQAAQQTAIRGSTELMTVKLRFKPLGEQTSRLLSLAVNEAAGRQTSDDFRFAAAVAGYGMLLTRSAHLGTFTWEQCLDMARSGRGSDGEGYRAELYRLVEASQLLARQQERPNASGPRPMPGPVLR